MQTKLNFEKVVQNSSNELKTFKRPKKYSARNQRLIDQTDVEKFFKSKNTSKRSSPSSLSPYGRDLTGLNILSAYSLVAKQDLSIQPFLSNYGSGPTSFFTGLNVPVVRLEAEDRLDREVSWTDDLFAPIPIIEEEEESEVLDRCQYSSPEDITEFDEDEVEEDQLCDVEEVAMSIPLNEYNPDNGLFSYSPKLDQFISPAKSHVSKSDDSLSPGVEYQRVVELDFLCRDEPEAHEIVVLTDKEELYEQEDANFAAISSNVRRKSIKSISDRRRNSTARAHTKAVLSSSFSDTSNIHPPQSVISLYKAPMFETGPISNFDTHDLEYYDRELAQQMGFSSDHSSDLVILGDTSINGIRNSRSQSTPRASAVIAKSKGKEVIVIESSSEDEIENSPPRNYGASSSRSKDRRRIEASSSEKDDDDAVLDLHELRAKGDQPDILANFMNQFEPIQKKKRKEAAIDDAGTPIPKKKKSYGSRRGGGGFKKKAFYKRRK